MASLQQSDGVPAGAYPGLDQNLTRRAPDFDTLAQCVELGLMTEEEAGAFVELLATRDALHALANVGRRPGR